MKKIDYKELMILSIYGELSEEEERKLSSYLHKNADAKKEYSELKKLNSFLQKNSESQFNEQLLADARNELRAVIRRERAAAFRWKEFLNVNFFRLPQFQFAALALVMFALGGATTQFICAPDSIELQKMSLQNISNREIPAEKRTKISNIQFLDSDASDGEIEFRFEATAPMYVKGKVSDPEIQKILSYALLNEANPGTRISTVNAIADHAAEGKVQDSKMKSALLRAMQSDDNAGVRREAMRVLLQFPFDNEIRDALFFILSNDKNTGMRVAAINALEAAKMDGKQFDKNVLEQLKRTLHKENNSYVRTRAENLIGEMYQ